MALCSIKKGAVLVEMMVSLLLSAILLAEIFRYSFYLEKSAVASFNQIDFVEKENVLFAGLVQDIEKAGYLVCASSSARNVILDDTGQLKSTWLSASNDMFFSQYMSTEQFRLLDIVNGNEVLVDGRANFKVNDAIFLANCWEAQVLKIAKIGSVNYDEKKRLTFYSSIKLNNYSSVYAGQLIQHQYYVNDSSLYLRDERNNNDKMLDGILSLKVSHASDIWTLSVEDKKTTKIIALKAKAYNE